MITSDELAAIKSRCDAATRKPGTYITDSGARGRIYTRCSECHEAVPLYDHKSSCSGFERNKEAAAFAADALRLTADNERMSAVFEAAVAHRKMMRSYKEAQAKGDPVYHLLLQTLSTELNLFAAVDAAEGGPS